MNKATVTIHSDNPPADFVERVRRALTHINDWCKTEIPQGRGLAYKVPMKLETVEAIRNAAKVSVELDLDGVDPTRYEKAVSERFWDFLGNPLTGVTCDHGPLDIEIDGEPAAFYEGD